MRSSLLVLALAGCAQPPTWSADLKPVVEQNCAECHSTGGGAPFPLTTYEESAPRAAQLAATVEAGTMPPWMPDPACATYEGQRTLSAEQIALFRAWADAGAPAGDETAAIEPPGPPELEAITIRASAPGYTPKLEDGDDYRCFVLDTAFDHETFITGSDVAPGSSLVHHVLVYAFGADQREAIEASDAASDGLGYTCLGAPFPSTGTEALSSGLSSGFPNQIAGWVPGHVPTVLADGTAMRIEPGSLVVMQVHYSALGGDAVPDATELLLQTTDQAPEQIARTSALVIHDLDIPPGDPDVQFTFSTPYYADEPVRLQNVMGHMHLLGSSISAQVEVADEPPMCLLDIPDWDFHWQQSYVFPELVEIPPDSHVRLTCAYDNSIENQPVVDGEQIDPREVHWGEETLDEMCLLFVVRVDPYEPLPADDEAPCASAADCVQSCPDGSVDCLLSCDDASVECQTCALSEINDCASDCILDVATANRDCVRGCIMGTALLEGNVGECLQNECGGPYTDFLQCVDTRSCDLTACGVEL